MESSQDNIQDYQLKLKMRQEQIEFLPPVQPRSPWFISEGTKPIWLGREEHCK